MCRLQTIICGGNFYILVAMASQIDLFGDNEDGEEVVDVGNGGADDDEDGGEQLKELLSRKGQLMIMTKRPRKLYHGRKESCPL